MADTAPVKIRGLGLGILFNVSNVCSIRSLAFISYYYPYASLENIPNLPNPTKCFSFKNING